MKYCLRCAREIGEGHNFCPYCGTPQKEIKKPSLEQTGNNVKSKVPIILGVVFTFVILILVVAFAEKPNVHQTDSSWGNKTSLSQEKSFSSPVISVSARQILNDFKNNEIRAGNQYNGKRVRISGCAASIDNAMGILSVFINSCGGEFDLDYVHALFPNSAKDRLSRLNRGQKVVVECDIDDGGDVLGVSAENCILK